MGQQSSKTLFSSPASQITGKSLAEKLDRLEKQLKKKEQLRGKIDPSMYNLNNKSQRFNAKSGRQNNALSRNNSSASRSSILGRRMSRGSASRTDLALLPEHETVSVPTPSSAAPTQAHVPKAPPGKPRQLPSSSDPPPPRKHRKLSMSKLGMQATDKEGNCAHSTSFDSTETLSPKAETTRKYVNQSDSSVPNLINESSQTSLPLNACSPTPADRKGKKKNSPGNSNHKAKFESSQSTVGQQLDFAEKVKKNNKNEMIEVLPTVQYYSSPDKLCKTTPGEFLVLNGNLLDDPSKKYFHPVKNEKAKPKEKSSSGVKKSSNYVADIMRIGLSNKEIYEREKMLIAQKKKLGIPKDGYIEGIRSKNNQNLFKIQKETIIHRQNLNRRANEFQVVKKEYTSKGIEALTKKELGRSSLRSTRLKDLAVEDSMWKSKVSSPREERIQASLFGESMSSTTHHHLNDASQMSDFKHVQHSQSPRAGNNDNPESQVPTKVNPKKFKRMDSVSEKEAFQQLLKQKVIESVNIEIESTIVDSHHNMSLVSVEVVSPRAGENAFLANQSRMEEVMESQAIQYLEANKWILLVIDLVKGIAAKRKAIAQKMESLSKLDGNSENTKEKDAGPKTPNEVFIFIACLLRIILAGATVQKETFFLLIQKVFSKFDHNGAVTNQVITLVRTCLGIGPREYCEFLISIDIRVCFIFVLTKY